MRDRPNLKGRLSIFVTLWLITVFSVIQLFTPEITESIQFTRSEVLAGQWWRLVSGHFVHLSWLHLATNALALGLFHILLGPKLTLVWWVASVLTLTFIVSLGLFTLSQDIHWYVGFSGVLTGLYIFGAMLDLVKQPFVNIGIIVIILSKIIYEQAAGLSITNGIGNISTVVDAHLYGAIGGAVLGVIGGFGGRYGVSDRK